MEQTGTFARNVFEGRKAKKDKTKKKPTTTTATKNVYISSGVSYLEKKSNIYQTCEISFQLLTNFPNAPSKISAGF